MGAGAWGTALAKVLADAGNNVTLWARRPELADEINDTHHNAQYLDDCELPKSIRATSDPAEALAGACTVLFAVPAQTRRGWRSSPAPTSPARSPTSSRQRRLSPAATRAGRWLCSVPCQPRTSGRTPMPT